jgi:hypothetical protein
MAGGLALAGAAEAADFRLQPSLLAVFGYDDNVLAQPSARGESRFTRLTPRLRTLLESRSLSLSAAYTHDGELFHDLPEFTSARARMHGSLDVRWRPGSRGELHLGASYLDTLTPSELNPLTGLLASRAQARRLALTAAGTWRLGRLSTATLELGRTADELLGGPSADVDMALLSLERHFSRHTTLGVAGAYRRFRLDGGAAPDSAVLQLLWKRDVGRHWALGLQGGSRWTGSAYRPEVEASLRRSSRRGDVSLAYIRTQATALGQLEPLDTEGLSLALGLRTPRWLQLAVSPAAMRSRAAGLEARVYRVDARAVCRLARWLGFEAALGWTRQEGGALLGEAILHRVAFVGLRAGGAGTE